jgi:hypothetical protein
MLFPELVASPVVLTNSRGMAADTMAEHVLAVTLALFRRLPDAWRSQEARQWAQDAIGLAGTRTIAGTRVLVIGLGAIGTAVATRMAALGAEVAGIRRRESGPAPAGVARVAGPGALPELLGSADVVVLSAPHTRETRRMIGVRELAAMSRDAVLVNVSRGGLVDEAALAPAAGQPVLDAPQRAHHPSHVRLPPGPLGRSDRPVRRKSPTLRGGRAAPQRRGQARRVLTQPGSDVGNREAPDAAVRAFRFPTSIFRLPSSRARHPP